MINIRKPASKGQRIAVSVREAAESIGVSPGQVRSWCHEYQSTHGRTGLRHARPAARLFLIQLSDLQQFLDSKVPA